MKKESALNEKIGLVLSTFNKDISTRLKEGALEELEKEGIKNFEILEVPGVMEIPLSAQWLFQKDCQVVIALGCVIRGETSHYEACCRLVEQGCMQVQLKMNRPLVFGNTHDRKQGAGFSSYRRKKRSYRMCLCTNRLEIAFNIEVDSATKNGI